MIIKNPKGKHTSFRVMRRKGNGYETVHHPDIDIINTELKAGRLSAERARLALEEVRIRLEKAEVKPVSWLTENMAIAQDFYEQEIVPKGNRRPEAARDRIFWAVKQLGATKLLASTKAELVKALEHLDINSRRRALSVVNSLLKFKAVPVRCPLPKREKQEIDYLTLEELAAVLEVLKYPEWKLLAKAAFGTGARYGELFATELRDLRNKGTHVWIGWQRLQDWTKVPTKNDKEGATWVVEECRTALVDWIKVDVEVKREMRRKELPGEYFADACEKAIGRRLTFHNLRHSYAHHMLHMGAGLPKLKNWMRDRMSTIEDYYLSWVQTDSELENDVRMFAKKKA